VYRDVLNDSVPDVDAHLFHTLDGQHDEHHVELNWRFSNQYSCKRFGRE